MQKNKNKNKKEFFKRNYQNMNKTNQDRSKFKSKGLEWFHIVKGKIENTLVMATAAQARLSLLFNTALYSSESTATTGGEGCGWPLDKTAASLGAMVVSLDWGSTSATEEEEGGDVAETEASWRKRWKAHSEALRLIVEDSSAPETWIGGDQKWSGISSTENTLSMVFVLLCLWSIDWMCLYVTMVATTIYGKRDVGVYRSKNNSDMLLFNFYSKTKLIYFIKN